ncbi:hypothetical protein DMB92_04040 [Campylobacter sp. MIT 99-7217]|uniref:hypothetical protein n=1 Tax=Campylobacter sp. MIT 99-7217 TaxID=535091 RepID=UPI001158CAA5|nr:hypothetical protein [Campylobacter sp. MIT 99-7217]TQR33135.1 hypothetical protein DMB92_04040 [Campylobacter sp. MIT 99-7217]
MIKPRPFLKKCLNCKKLFLCSPKSDVLNPADFICPSCRGEKGLLEKGFELLTNVLGKNK